MNQTVYLIGVGMGNPNTLTAEAGAAIAACTLLIGAPRLLAPYRDGGKDCAERVVAAEIADLIHAQPEGAVVGVLLSGDVGFYSGAKGLYPLLESCRVEVIPGISSLVYFCAKLRTPWQDAHLVSVHGRAHNAAGAVQSHEKTFLLTGGETGAREICDLLCARGLGHLTLWVGERLSYPDEIITCGTARELTLRDFDSLSVMLVVNPAPIRRVHAAPGLPDDAFLRGEAPMTKEEVRALALCKLRLEPSHVLWDVGAGTGSVAIEGALALTAGQVWAVEKKPEALALLAENKARFGATNLELVAGEAPAVLRGLPAPDRVFLGGTSGGLAEILTLVLERNPAARVVAAAITLETLTECLRCFQGMDGVELVQVSVAKAREVGAYHMMTAQNPIWLISGEGRQ